MADFDHLRSCLKSPKAQRYLNNFIHGRKKNDKR